MRPLPTTSRRRRRASRRRTSTLKRALSDADAWLEARGVAVCTTLLALAVVGSVLAIGSVHVGALLCVAPVAIASGAIALWVQRTSWRAVPAPVWVILALAAYTLLQALPLPIGFVAWIAPRNAEVWQSSLALLDDPSPRWVSASLDPGATLVEALKWLSYALAFAAAAFVGRSKGTTWPLLMVFSSAALVALVTLAHKAAGATAVYGVYRPEFAHPNFSLSPLLNSNNLAGYLNLGAFAGLGLLASRRKLGPRWLVAVGVSVTIAVSTLTASRGGWLSLLVGIPLLVVALLRSRSSASSGSLKLVLWLPLAAFAGGIALFALGASDAVWRALRDEGVKKLDLIAWSGPMISEHRFIGVGRGAFETSFPVFRQDAGHHLYAHAENFVAHWSAEWGVPVAAAALLAFAWFLRPRQLGTRRSAAAATAAVGVVVLLLQNLVDLALELPSVALALVALLGGLWGAATSGRRDPSRQSSAAWLPPAFALAAAGAAVLVGVAWSGRQPAGAERRELSARVDAARDSERAAQLALLDDIGGAIRRHPADPHLPLLGAITAQRAGKNALPWVGRAIERDPMAGRAHLMLAHVLATRGAKGQALLAVRMAVERDHGVMGRAAKLAVGVSQSFEALVKAAPDGWQGPQLLVAMARELTKPERAAVRAQLLDEAVRRDPKNESALNMRAEDIVRKIESKHEACSGEAAAGCTERALALIEALERATPDSARAAVFRARLLVAENRAREAERLLAARCKLVPAHLDCLRWRVIAAEKLESPSELSAASNAYLEAACAAPNGCGNAATWVGDRLAAKDQWEAAVAMYERAARESGDRAAWERLAKAATRAGNESLAMRAWQKANATRKLP